MNLYRAVSERARADRPALQVGSVVLEYGELFTLVRSASAAMVAAGVERNMRIVSLLPNGIEHVVAVLAAGVAGGIIVPCDPTAGRVRLAHVIRETSPRLCLVPAGAETPSGCDSLRIDFDTATRSLCFDPPSDGLGSAQSDADTRDAVIRFTSGSTGRPKGVVLEHVQVVSTARLLGDVFGLGNDHRELIVTPMSHSGGWQRVAATLLGGGCVVVPEGEFSIPAMLDDIERFEITGFFAPPPVIRLLLAAQTIDDALGGCRSIEVGSASLTAAGLERLLALAPAAR